MTARRVGHHLRSVAARIVEAGGADGEEVGHGGKGHVDRRSAGLAKIARFDIAAVGGHVPAAGLAADLDARPQETQVRTVAGAVIGASMAVLSALAEDLNADYGQLMDDAMAQLQAGVAF